jgi:hypothetical protein
VEDRVAPPPNASSSWFAVDRNISPTSSSGTAGLLDRDCDRAGQGARITRIAPRRETAPCPTSRSDLFNGSRTSVGKGRSAVFTNTTVVERGSLDALGAIRVIRVIRDFRFARSTSRASRPRSPGSPGLALIAPFARRLHGQRAAATCSTTHPRASGVVPRWCSQSTTARLNEEALMPSEQFGSSGQSEASGLLDRDLDRAGQEARISRINPDRPLS